MTEPGWFPDPMSPFMVRWWDGQAWTTEVRPGGGGPDPAADVADEAKAGRMATRALWAGAIVYAGRMFMTVVLVRKFWPAFRSWLDTPAPRDRFVMPSGVTGLNALSQLFSIGILVVGVLFLIWFYKAAVLAAKVGLPHRLGSAWAIAGWIVPVVNLWFPYQSAVDLLPPGSAGRSKVKQWWALWITLGTLSLASIAGSFVSAEVGLALAALASATAFAAAWAGQGVIEEVDGAHAEAIRRAQGAVAGGGGRYR